uniref:Uncharacterized protein n=1 Tax=Oryza barthii TaxID=65489 RepID=A0A0D3EPL2_9ORYZ
MDAAAGAVGDGGSGWPGWCDGAEASKTASATEDSETLTAAEVMSVEAEPSEVAARGDWLAGGAGAVYPCTSEGFDGGGAMEFLC